MASFQIRIQNLGRLADATVRVRPFTALAGANNTGKSFFSKALYSIFDAMNANHALMQIQGMVEPLRPGLWELRLADDIENIPLAGALESAVKRLEEMCDSLRGRGDELAAVREMHGDLVKVAREIVRVYGDLRPQLAGLLEHETHPFDSSSLKGMEAGIENLKALAGHSPEDIVFKGFRRALQRNLLGNFQVPTLAGLKRDADKEVAIDLEGVGNIAIANGSLSTRVHPAGLMRLRLYSRGIYLESPVHWKVAGPLGDGGRWTLPFGDGMDLTAPKYFRDLQSALGRKYAGEVAFPELLARLTGEHCLGGQIIRDDTGELGFREHGRTRPFSLPLTATGVVNLGILALLIERKLIDKGTFLFIDEPESNLHPEWQVAMTEALWELAANGVNVVIATHSVDILKRLQIYAQESPDEAKRLLAMNHFQRDGTVQSGGTEKILDVQEDLSMPFFELYKRGLS